MDSWSSGAVYGHYFLVDLDVMLELFGSTLPSDLSGDLLIAGPV